MTPRPLAFVMTLAEPFTLNVNPHFAELMPAAVDVRRKAYGTRLARTRPSPGGRRPPA